MLCGEVVGAENPYVVHRYKEAEKFGFFVFDIREKGTNTPTPLTQKNKILDNFGISKVRLFGIFKKEEAAENVFRIIKELARESAQTWKKHLISDGGCNLQS